MNNGPIFQYNREIVNDNTSNEYEEPSESDEPLYNKEPDEPITEASTQSDMEPDSTVNMNSTDNEIEENTQMPDVEENISSDTDNARRVTFNDTLEINTNEEDDNVSEVNLDEIADDNIEPVNNNKNTHNYNLRSGPSRAFDRHIGRVNGGGDFIFVQHGGKETWQQRDERWSKDIYIQLLEMTESANWDGVQEDMMDRVVNYIFTQAQDPPKFSQMSAKKGIKVFSEKAVAALIKEYQQLHDKSVFEQIKKEDLTNGY